ncbi:SUN domain-containing protein 3 [Podochytrium sp. JEL0797]|nr:SUN domain-containing protein 3 [Podochytrium sp. JEL0797]
MSSTPRKTRVSRGSSDDGDFPQTPVLRIQHEDASSTRRRSTRRFVAQEPSQLHGDDLVAASPRTAKKKYPALSGPAASVVKARRKTLLTLNDDSDETLDEALEKKLENEQLEKENAKNQRSPWEKLAAFSPIRLFTRPKKPDFHQHDDDDESSQEPADDQEEEEVIETVQFEYDNSSEQDSTQSDPIASSILESPTEFTRTAFEALWALLVSIYLDFIQPPVSHLVKLYNSLYTTSKIGFLIIAISITSVLLLNQRGADFPLKRYTEVAAYLPPKWGDLTIWPSFMDRNVPLFVDWYETVIVHNVERLNHVYVPPMFKTGDGGAAVEESTRWNLFFPLSSGGVRRPRKGEEEKDATADSSGWEIWIPTHRGGDALVRLWTQGSASIRDGMTSLRTMMSRNPSPDSTHHNAFANAAEKIDWSSLATAESEALASRVAALETTLRGVQAGFHDAAGSFDGLHSATRKMRDAVAAVETKMKEVVASVEVRVKALEGEDDVMAARVGKFVKELEAVKRGVEALGEEDEGDKKRDLVQDEKMKGLEARVAGLMKELKGVHQRVEESEKAVGSKMVQMMQDLVPSMVVAKKDAKTDKVVLDPEFWGLLKEKIGALHAQTVKADPADVSEPRIRELISEKLHAATKGLVSAADIKTLVSELIHTQGFETAESVEHRLSEFAHRSHLNALDASVRQQIQESIASLPSFTDLETALAAHSATFLEKNKQHVTDVLAGNGSPAHMILTREQVMHLLHDEIAATTASLTTLVETKVSALSPAERAKLEAEAMKDILDTLIATAMDKFAADGIGRADYALEATGGHVVQALTSEPYQRESKSMVGRWMGYKQRVGWGPFVAISEGNQPGKCWAMEGSSGTLGIRLAQPILPTAFTVDHASPLLLLSTPPSSLSTSPKRVELWVLYSDTAKLDYTDPATRKLPTATEKLPAGMLVSTQTFDPKVKNVQTFEVDAEAGKVMRERGVLVKTVVLRVVENWGNEAYTCLYRVRVHGR